MRLAHKTTWGSRPEPLFDIRLAGIAVGPQGHLWALGDACLKRFSQGGKAEAEISLDALGWSLTYADARLWVGADGRVSQYATDGKLMEQWNDAPRLGRVTGIAVSEENLVVADATNRCLHQYSRDGQWLRQVGAEANTRGFMIPNGILDLDADTSNPSVLVAHPQKHRVERYSWEGELVEKWGRFGMTDPADFGGCCNPTNLAVAADGVIAVSEKAPPRVKLFSPRGEFLAESAGDLFDLNAKNIDLVFGNSATLYATDPQVRCIHVFEVHSD